MTGGDDDDDDDDDDDHVGGDNEDEDLTFDREGSGKAKVGKLTVALKF